MKGFSTVANRYAGALLSLSNEANSSQVIAQDFASFLDVWNQSSEVRSFLKNPVLQPGLKIPFIQEAFGKSFQDLTLRFMVKMVRARRASLLGEVAESFAAQYRRQQKVLEVQVKSAVPLSDSTRKAIQDWVMGQSEFSGWKSIALHEQVQSDLIGGLVLQVEGQELDLSLERKLEDFRKEFSKNLYVPDF